MFLGNLFSFLIQVKFLWTYTKWEHKILRLFTKFWNSVKISVYESFNDCVKIPIESYRMLFFPSFSYFYPEILWLYHRFFLQVSI